MSSYIPYFVNSESAIVTSRRILYTASSFAKSSLLHLQEIGELKAQRPHTSSRSNLHSYLFFTVVSGSGSLTYDSKEYVLVTGSCVFIDCQKAYAHHPNPDDLWTLRWCHFYGPTMTAIYDKYVERGGKPAFIPIDSTFYDTLSSVWKNLMVTAVFSDDMSELRINEQIATVLTLVMSESWHPKKKTQQIKRTSALDVKRYLDEHYTVKITLESLCEQFFISKYYLSHSFKEQFGVSVLTYLKSVRITHAKQLLRFTDKSIEEIGYESGIGALHYFSRVFKDVEGVAPSVYREQW